MTNHTTLDVEAVAASLTKAQREAVAGAIYRAENGAWHPAGWYFNADRRVRLRLKRKGLIPDYLPAWSRLTSQGESVRAALLKEKDQ